MRMLNPQERAAIDAVARRFSATWEQGGDASDAWLRIRGKRVAVDVAALRRRGSGQGDAAGPRLRFDKVATRLMARLRAAADDIVPNGTTVWLTITAPIRLPSKTADSLEAKMRTLLGRGSVGRDAQDTIHGNRILIRRATDESGRAPKFMAFVHHADSDPRLLLNLTRDWLELAAAEAGRLAPGLSEPRWLVVRSAGASSSLEAHRDICSQLRLAPGVQKILLVCGDGRIGVLRG